MARSRSSSTRRARGRPERHGTSIGLAADRSWAFVSVCMHCRAVVFLELPGGRRLWVPAESDVARLFRRGPVGGPPPQATHSICRACVHQHHPELVSTFQARFPAAGY